MSTPPNAPSRNRNRGMLIALVVIFLGSFAVAGALRFSGWRPSGLKNHGELLQPPSDLRQQTPTLADGSTYRWNPVERTWRIVVAPPADCGNECIELAREINLVWQLFGHNADDVHVLWIGTPPAGVELPDTLRQLQPSPALLSALPRADERGGRSGRDLPVYVVDPNGFVILRYAPGFDPGDLRSDMARLLKLR
ncbi:hypothetical protein IP90_00138 [Luteimonas cucumeris]|uniref:Cytochrome oxidase Cu insertion factor (SCO1/SenC/PrrC family) n=1 Tax=Luteimonas cucumeris TaxID=985012 RepID=A0A562LE90_9GAMM|nr:hypothetical protein [Luteimonas cucumeris]TWI05876.1 hypothetical protein IP90_00138 [Luteimonas cucumeris]